MSLPRYFSLPLLAAALAFAGCATQLGMARLDSPEAVAKSTRPVFLMTVTLKNSLVAAYQPKLVAIKIQQTTGPDSARILLFNIDELAKNETVSPQIGNTYLVRFELPTGEYTLLGLNSIGQSMFTEGKFFTPLLMPLSAKTPGVHYLGHVDAVVRKRQGDEPGAGGNALPVQEQREVGAFGGTFDVVVSDQWATDSAKFYAKIPALRGVDVQSDVLPAFNRQSVQRWWDSNAFQAPYR